MCTFMHQHTHYRLRQQRQRALLLLLCWSKNKCFYDSFFFYLLLQTERERRAQSSDCDSQQMLTLGSEQQTVMLSHAVAFILKLKYFCLTSCCFLRVQPLLAQCWPQVSLPVLFVSVSEDLFDITRTSSFMWLCICAAEHSQSLWLFRWLDFPPQPPDLGWRQERTIVLV